jgi:uncharacterized protein
MLPFLRQVPDGVSVSIKLQPRARADEIAGLVGDELKIRVTAPPVEAAANEALLQLLARKLGRPRSSVRLIRGQTSRHKLIHLSGVTPEFVASRLLP